MRKEGSWTAVSGIDVESIAVFSPKHITHLGEADNDIIASLQ